jgi:predicted nucleic acid-binding protein
VTLIDTSAWIEYLRDTGSRACQLVDGLVVSGFVTTSPVRMKLLAGARSPAHLDQLRRLLARGGLIAVVETDYEDAAAIYRACRLGGETVRRLIDCLIAAVALREGVPVLHADRDFDVIARHTALLVAS